jgi:hypothetical protein
MVCPFLNYDASTGVASICGAPVDTISSGMSCCAEHFRIMAEQSIKEMRRYMEHVHLNTEGAAYDDDDEMGAVEYPSFEIKTPPYLG